MSILLSTELLDIVTRAFDVYFKKGLYQEFINSLDRENRSIIASWMYERNPKYLNSFNRIPEGMFTKSPLMCNIVLPSSVKTIEKRSFDGSQITGITIPDSVELIGEAAFQGCKNLVSVELPEGLTVVPNKCFNGCSKLSKVYIPASVFGIGVEALMDCSPSIRIYTPHKKRAELKNDLQCAGSERQFIIDHLVNTDL